jgi:hypothetical protein
MNCAYFTSKPTLLLLLLLAAFSLGGSARAQTTLSSALGSAPTAAASAAKPALLSPSSIALIQFNNQILFSVRAFGDESAQDRADIANLRLAAALRGVFADRTAGRR